MSERSSAAVLVSHGSDGRLGWRADVTAGLCVAGILMPEAVAYAGLAQLPVVHALTACLMGLLIYALLGGSRYAVVAPTSSTATLGAAAALGLAARGPDGLAHSIGFVQAFMALVLAAGLMLMLLGAARQGQLSAYVSRPVLRGFSFALAITIVIKQLPDALGFKLPAASGGDPLHVLVYTATHVALWQPVAVLVALVAGAAMALLRRWPQWPASMLVMVAAIALTRLLGLPAYGLEVVGQVDFAGLSLTVPRLSLAEWLQVIELAVGLMVLIFAESWGSMRTLALLHGDSLNPNRELLVLGACNVGAALCQGMPVGGGFSASVANSAAGARSRMAGAVALAMMVLVLLFALPALQMLPRSVLAVVVISALWHALSPKPLVAVWRMRRDRVLILGAVVAVLMLGVLHGMMAAIGLSLVEAMRRFSEPVVHELGELGASRNFVALDMHPDAQILPRTLIVRPEAPLFFASAERVGSAILSRVRSRSDIDKVLLSLEESADLDSTAVECLMELNQRLARDGRTLMLVRVKDPVRDLLQRCDPQGLGQAERMFWSVADAVRPSGMRI
ncbi:MAG: SulP family inorganic anion transporter [Burkholderiaceae bacterium]|nr:SulP family inorganic anion transporter [Roseateles sp.]MBV8470582.1 SulP family inorganic anion transporter [Burkholderiaceae bacterium]